MKRRTVQLPLLLLAGVLALSSLTACEMQSLPLDTFAHDTTLESVGEADTTSAAAPYFPFTGATVTLTAAPPSPAFKPLQSTEVLLWMEDHVLLNSKIDPAGYAASGDAQFTPSGVLPNLFDEICTRAEWDYANKRNDSDYEYSDDQIIAPNPGGSLTYTTGPAALYWSMCEPVTLGSYVIYTGPCNGNGYSGRNPVSWYLYGSNDPIDASSIDPESFTDPSLPSTPDALEEAGYVLLDYVYDGGMKDVDLTPYGYAIGDESQGEYQHYCWYIESNGGSDFTIVSGMKLYAAD